jgi:hypothetical protein
VAETAFYAMLSMVYVKLKKEARINRLRAIGDLDKGIGCLANIPWRGKIAL